MKTSSMKRLLAIFGTMLYVPSTFSHTSGEHGGGWLQQIMHILQSTDHLFIILALGVVVSMMIRHIITRMDD